MQDLLKQLLVSPDHVSSQSSHDSVLEFGSFVHAVEDEMLCSSSNTDKVPWFNAPIYLQNKSVIGKVDEILGPINEMYFSVKMNEGMIATSFKKGDRVYIGGDKLFPIERFLPKPKVAGGKLLIALSIISISVLSYRDHKYGFSWFYYILILI
jgi:H/ACA ribonucleoprotein complex subunit 1